MAKEIKQVRPIKVDNEALALLMGAKIEAKMAGEKNTYSDLIKKMFKKE